MARKKNQPTVDENGEPRVNTRSAGMELINRLTEAAKKPEKMPDTPEGIFRLYAMFVGDIERTSIACNKSVDDILEMETAGNWRKRIAVLIKLQKSGIPGDAERGVNRAINFIQADRMRELIERIVRMLTNMSDDNMLANLLSVVEDRYGNTTSRILTRPYADLATALEKCHAMTYQALSDTATDRKDRRDTEDKNATAGEMHMALVDAFAKVRHSQKVPQLPLDSLGGSSSVGG